MGSDRRLRRQGALPERELRDLGAGWDFWLAPGTPARAPDWLKGMALANARILKCLERKVERRGNDEEIATGLRFVETFGHTPGHMSVMVEGSRERLLIGADALSHAAVSFARPDWRWGSDCTAIGRWPPERACSMHLRATALRSSAFTCRGLGTGWWSAAGSHIVSRRYDALKGKSMRKSTTIWIAIASAATVGCVTVAAIAQQALSGTQKLMVVAAPRLPGKVHVLPATLDTTQWGWFDNAELPRLTIDSGDTVVFETMSHSHGQLYPGRTIEELKKLRTDWPGRGPMTLTGPVFVNGAEPGDVLQIKINRIVARPWGANFNVPGMFGQFPKEFPDGQVKYFYLDWERKVAEFAPGIEIPLRPFPGTLGVARAQPGRYNAVPPGPFAGNLDNRDLVEGTTLHVPVFVRGALVWTGDSHAAQGNGEVNLTALETAFQEINVTITVDKTRKRMAAHRDGSDWIAMGFDEDLGRRSMLREARPRSSWPSSARFLSSRPLAWCRRLRIAASPRWSTSRRACTAWCRRTRRAHGRSSASEYRDG